IKHRLHVAGGGSLTFTPEAAALVAELSRGLPRRVNVLCDRALQEGRIQGAASITPEIVKQAARSLVNALEERPVETVGEAVPAETPNPEDASAILHTFWQTNGRGWRIRGAAAAGVLLTVGVLGYGYYAHDLVSAGPIVPAQPAAPKRDLRL